MNLREYFEKLSEGSEAEKIMVSKPLLKIKGKKPNYRKPWVKFLRKSPGTYIALPE